MTLPHQLLALAARHPFVEDNAEAGIGRVQALLGRPHDPAALHGALAALVRDGLLRDPVLLTDQSLQCRWRFIPTPEGLAAAVTLPGDA